MPSISIIMPCLNSEKYISEAIESVLNQTLSDFEFIIVDSGSSDNTSSILEKYSLKDNRIKILQCKHKSMGAQYNLGISVAKGKYLGFVESDDFIDSYMFQTLYETIEENETDYVKSDFDYFVDLSSGRLNCRSWIVAENQRNFYGKVLSPFDISQLVRRDIYMWNGLYNRTFVQKNNIYLQETLGAAFQDAGFISQVLMFAKSGVYLDQSFYRYRIDNLTASTKSINTYKFIMSEFSYLFKKISKSPNADLFIPSFLRRFFGTFHNCLRQYLYRVGYDDQLEICVKPFLKEFNDQYKQISFSQLTKSDLWPPEDLGLCLHDFKAYCRVSLQRYQSDISCQQEAVKYFLEQDKIIICGSGENVENIRCYLTRCGLRDFSIAKDNEVLDVIKQYPTAVYVLSQNVKLPHEFEKILLLNGISLEKICRYGSGIFHHNWHELPLIERSK